MGKGYTSFRESIMNQNPRCIPLYSGRHKILASEKMTRKFYRKVLANIKIWTK